MAHDLKLATPGAVRHRVRTTPVLSESNETDISDCGSSGARAGVPQSIIMRDSLQCVPSQRQRARQALLAGFIAVLVLRTLTMIQFPTLPDAAPISAGGALLLATNPHTSAAYAERVRNAMVRNFGAYWRYCRGRDEYIPIDRGCSDWFQLGLTAVDSADTLYIMGLKKQYRQVANWARNELDIKNNKLTASLFELIIRALGGLNSAYALTGDEVWKYRAWEIGNAVINAFNTSTGCPRNSEVTLNAPLRSEYSFDSILMSTAEAGSLQLELRTLANMTGDARFSTAADRCVTSLITELPDWRVVPTQFLPDTADGHVAYNVRTKQTIGAHVDSFIEMLLKTWIAGGKRDDILRNAFERQVELTFQQLASTRNSTLFIGVNSAPINSASSRAPTSTMEHLTCFFPAVLALGALHGLGGGLYASSKHDYIHRARRLTRTCFLMSRSNEFGLAPEISRILPNGSLVPNSGAEHSLLRPEIVEALYVMYVITKDETYRKWGKIMFDDIEKHGTLHDGTLSSSWNLASHKLSYRGKLHSFVLAETLKYLFLLFRDPGDGPSIDLKNWVFNTEAHPVPVLAQAPL